MADDPQFVPRPGVFAPGRRFLTSGLVAITTLIAFESMSVSTVMPIVEADLGDLALYGWVFSAFFLGTLVGVVVAGTAADRMRPAVPFVAGLVLFSIGLVVGGLAPSMPVLVAGRALQGLGGGAMPAVSYVCIGRGYPVEQRPTMFALVSSAWMVPSVAGPLVAAAVAQAVGWRWVFLGLLPLCGVIGVMAAVGIAHVGAPAEPSSERNIARAVGVAFGAALLLVGLGASTPFIGVPVALGGVVIAGSAYRRLTPAGTLRARAGLPAAVAVRGLLNFAYFGSDAFVPFVVTSVRGLSPVVGGLALTSSAVTWTVGSWLQARWVEAHARRLVAVGVGLIGVGSGAMALVLWPAVPAWSALVWWGIAGFGMGLSYSPIAHVALQVAGAGREGRISTALQLSDTLGVALGTGVAGALVASLASVGDEQRVGVLVTFAISTLVALFGASLAGRIPARAELA